MSKIKRNHFFILIILGLITFSCASREEKLENYKNLVEKLTKEIKVEDGFDNIFVEGKNRSRYRAYFKGDEIKFINEEMNTGNWAVTINKYFFKDGSLIHLSQKKIEYPSPENGLSGKKLTDFNLYLDGRTILESERLSGSTQQPLAPSEINAILNHTDALIKNARMNKPN